MFRTLLRILAFSFGGIAVLAVGLFTLAYFAFEPSKDAVASVKSPDGQFVATLIEGNGGATTSFSYEIVLAEAGTHKQRQEVAYLYGAGRNSSAYGANLRWESARHLVIEYLDADISELRNPKPVLGKTQVTVTLRPNITDPQAPPGGMLYNLKNSGR